MMSRLLKRGIFIHHKICLYKSQSQFCRKSTFQKEIEVPLNRQIMKFTVGELAKMADGCCVAQLGNTAVMAAVVGNKKKTSASSFVPLQVDYRHKFAAAACIPTNHRRREFGQSEKETLTSRAIDRSVRPLFPKGFSSDVQISCNPLAIDRVNDPDVLGINAASAALAVSEIPWNGPVGAVRVGIIDNKIVVNPSRQDMAKTALNLIVTATEQMQIVMMEGSAHHIPDDQFLEALEIGTNETQLIIKAIKELQAQFGKPKIIFDDPIGPSAEILESAALLCEAKISEILKDYSLDKIGRGKAMDCVMQEAIGKLKENYTECDPSSINEAIYYVVKHTFRNLILETGKRCDGRNTTDLRNISCKIADFETLHGCALFERGQTQVLCTVAFDSIEASLHNDPNFETPGEENKHFMVHYEFPPYATNEIGRFGKFGRREVGHGALAEKSLRSIIPSEFPFTIRLTSDVLASNGSSSMATVCGGSLALMDAGVPISTPVAGLAMGLISVPDAESSHNIVNYKILTDILGLEDFMGDMDFKIAGSKDGMTGIQLDVKIPGLPLNIIKEILTQAADGKIRILNIMNDTISKPRIERKKNWPICENIEVPMDQVSHFIGLGGMNLKKIRSKTGVQLTQQEKGIFSLFAPDSEAMLEAKEIIDKLLQEEKTPELIDRKNYEATIVEIRDYGVMVTLYDGMKPALVKNSGLGNGRIRHPSALGLKTGQIIWIKYLGRDPVNGNMHLSQRALTIPS